MTTLDLDAMQQRCDEATEEPWFAGKDYDEVTTADGEEICNFHYNCRIAEHDIDFIFHARADLPACIARIRELEAAAAEMKHNVSNNLSTLHDVGHMAEYVKGMCDKMLSVGTND